MKKTNDKKYNILVGVGERLTSNCLKQFPKSGSRFSGLKIATKTKNQEYFIEALRQ